MAPPVSETESFIWPGLMADTKRFSEGYHSTIPWRVPARTFRISLISRESAHDISSDQLDVSRMVTIGGVVTEAFKVAITSLFFFFVQI